MCNWRRLVTITSQRAWALEEEKIFGGSFCSIGSKKDNTMGHQGPYGYCSQSYFQNRRKKQIPGKFSESRPPSVIEI